MNNQFYATADEAKNACDEEILRSNRSKGIWAGVYMLAQPKPGQHPFLYQIGENDLPRIEGELHWERITPNTWQVASY